MVYSVASKEDCLMISEMGEEGFTPNLPFGVRIGKNEFDWAMESGSVNINGRSVSKAFLVQYEDKYSYIPPQKVVSNEDYDWPEALSDHFNNQAINDFKKEFNSLSKQIGSVKSTYINKRPFKRPTLRLKKIELFK